MSKQLKAKRLHIYKSYPYVLAWFGFIIGMMVIAFGITYKLVLIPEDKRIYEGVLTNLWFAYFQQFTILTNLLLVVFYGLWLFAFKTRLFNSNKFLLFTSSYIVLVFTIAWFMMSPIFILGNMTHGDKLALLETLLVHLLTPGLFVTFAIFAMKYPKADTSLREVFVKNWLYATIYPLLYFTYVVIINMVCFPPSMWTPDCRQQLYTLSSVTGENTFRISVYYILTDYNPSCYIPTWDPIGNHWAYYEIAEGDYYPTGGNGTYSRLIIVFIVLAFYAIELVLFIYLNNRLNGAYLIPQTKHNYARKN